VRELSLIKYFNPEKPLKQILLKKKSTPALKKGEA
jgi:hypothetical protein